MKGWTFNDDASLSSPSLNNKCARGLFIGKQLWAIKKYL
jgi:hypothetical protein